MVPYERFDAWRAAHQLALQVYRVPASFRRYLDIALGSLSEVSYLLRFTRDRGILAEAEFKLLNELRNHAGRLTWRFHSSLTKTLAS
jgi:hypothetical protein